MSKIKNAFKNGKALIPFLTCGDPDPETTVQAICAAAEAGADMIELGIPFSDPTAEGPVVQEASLRALKNGVTTDRVFDLVREARRSVTVPIVFVTYANVVFSYGAERFLTACRDLAVDGLILPDLPFEEKEEFLPLCRSFGVDLISAVTLLSANRIPMIAEEADGFLYVLANGGGSRTEEETAALLAETMKIVRAHTDVPCAVEYAFTAPESARPFAGLADGVIAGTDMVHLLAEYGQKAPERIAEYTSHMKKVINF